MDRSSISQDFHIFHWGEYLFRGGSDTEQSSWRLGSHKKREEGDQRESGIDMEERKGSLEMGCRVLGGLFWAGYGL